MDFTQSVYWIALDMALCVGFGLCLFLKLTSIEREVLRVVGLMSERSAVPPVGEAFFRERFENLEESMRDFRVRLEHIEERVDARHTQVGRKSVKKRKDSKPDEVDPVIAE